MEETRLKYKRIGQGHPLIILHGLYGSGSNWLSMAKELAEFSEVFLIDQRNHGDSPHFDIHDYPSMMQDVVDFMDRLSLRKGVILGHSMGGKVAMWLATQYPHLVSRLIIADISPLGYSSRHPSRDHMGGHQKMIEAMLAIDFADADNLKDIEERMETSFPDRPLRQFLMKNIEKGEDDRYFWKINLEVLLANLEKMAEGLEMSQVPMEGYRQFPVLVVRGENSHYIQPEDERAIRKIFPLAQIVSLKDAGHWLHAEQPELFLETVKKFLLGYA